MAGYLYPANISVKGEGTLDQLHYSQKIHNLTIPYSFPAYANPCIQILLGCKSIYCIFGVNYYLFESNPASTFILLRYNKL